MYGWEALLDRQQGIESLSKLAPEGDPAHLAFYVLGQRRFSPAQRLELQSMLLRQIRSKTDMFNTFALAEFLSSPLAPCRDIPLAAVLYKYSADRKFAPAVFRLGFILAFYEPLHDPAAAEQLLRRAAEAGVKAAYPALERLYLRYQQDAAARRVYLAGKAAGVPEELYLKAPALDHERSTAEILPRHSGDNLTGLLELSKYYSGYVQRDLPGAVNALLLAHNSLPGDRQLHKMLAELDQQCALVLLMYVLSQDQLQYPWDWHSATVDAEFLVRNYQYLPTLRNEAELLKLLKQDTEKVLRSGLLLKLAEINYPLEKLLPLLPENIPGTLTGTVLAVQKTDATLQKLWSSKLLKQLAKLEPPPEPGVLRRELMPLIPGVALLKDLAPEPPPFGNVLWNLAVLFHADALSGNGEKPAAEAFLKRYPLRTLPASWQLYEKNFRKMYLKNL